MKYKKLSIIAHLPHIKTNEGFVAYEPYVREINLWAELFHTVIIYTEVTKGKPKWSFKTIPSNCIVKKIYLSTGSTLKSKIYRLFQYPFVCFQILFILINSEVLHFRSPGATTIIANLLNKFFNKRTIVKWATYFGEMPIKSYNIKWERNLLLNPPCNTRVLIYGQGSHQNHIPFFPAMFAEKEIQDLMKTNIDKKWTMPYQFICAGRLFIYKSFDLILHGLVIFKHKYPDIKWHLTIIGDGEERKKLETIVNDGNIMNEVSFIGSKPFNETIKYYQRSHIVIMPGLYEGWPKVVNEAWATGCLPFVVNFGNAMYPIKISNGGGACFEPDPLSFADSLAELLRKPSSEIEQMIQKGQQTNFEMTLEKYKEGIEKELKKLLI
jgi:glycosyltransferase involved in cell wall biosynthesis